MRFVRPLALCLVIAGCVAPRTRSVRSPAPPPSPASVASEPDASAPNGLPSEAFVTEAYGKRTRRDPTDLCEPVEENLARAEKAIVNDDRARTPRYASHAWDANKPPKYMDIIDRRYALGWSEKAMLKRNGFVVPARLPVRGYADALHDIYQSQLPIYISSDAILHAIFKGNDIVIAETERELLPRLDESMKRMHAALEKQWSSYPADVSNDLDIYLTVARSLLADDASPIHGLKMDAEAKPLIESAMKGTGGLHKVDLFGRERIVDFSQYTPRGHYAGDLDLERWFRGTMWLSRLELNLVSRKSRSSQPGIVPNPEETPREAVDALALADLAERAGVLDDLDRIELAWTEFAGKREDVSLRDLIALRKKASITTLSIPDSAEKLKVAIGNDFQRTTRIHYMPQGSLPLPAIATMLGPRIVPDAQVETRLVHSVVGDRTKPSFADVAFILGSDRAKTYLAHDLAEFPALAQELTNGRSIISAMAPTSMYTAWLGAIHDISAQPQGDLPSFTKTVAYQDFKLNTTVAAYGQLRHNYVLIAGQAYDEGGCEIPDGYVEPAPALYQSLAAYANRGAAALKRIGGSADSIAYFERLEKTLNVLLAITKHEIAGLPLSDEEKRFLSMTSEIVPPSSEGPGHDDGWYFDMFRNRHDAFLEHAFVADWFTSSNAQAVVYAGAKEPRLGFFVVDVGGEPRVMVGPVARAFEHVGPLDGRLKDKDAAAIGDLREPWAASYTAPTAPVPPLAIVSLYTEEATDPQIAVRSTRAIGNVTIELLGHHREVIGRGSANVGTGWTRIKIPVQPETYAELVRVRAADTSYELSNGFGSVVESIGGMPALEWEKVEEVRKKFQKP